MSHLLVAHSDCLSWIERPCLIGNIADCSKMVASAGRCRYLVALYSKVLKPARDTDKGGTERQGNRCRHQCGFNARQAVKRLIEH